MYLYRIPALEGVEFVIPPTDEEIRIVVGLCRTSGSKAVLGVQTVPHVRHAHVGREITKLVDTYVPYVPKSQRNQDTDAKGDPKG